MKTDPYGVEDVAKVVQIRANVEGLKLGPGVLDHLASEGERSSLRFVMSFHTHYYRTGRGSLSFARFGVYASGILSHHAANFTHPAPSGLSALLIALP